MDGITSLKEAIRTVPIPGSPPPGSREGAAVGLAFLDMALRQNHIRRLTERLTLVDRRLALLRADQDGRLVTVTHISHGSGGKEVSELVLGKMARQLRVSGRPCAARSTAASPIGRREAAGNPC